jgi:hypothetical protein
MNECIPVERLGTLESLPAADPMRRHAAVCPRCNALVFAYGEFVRAGLADGADARSAEARLDAFIATHVERRPAGAGATRQRRGLGAPRVRLQQAVAAAAAIAMIAIVVHRWHSGLSDGVVLRGSPAAVLSVEPAVREADGHVRLTWRARGGADAYTVSVLAADLSVIQRLGPTRDLTMDVDPGALPPGASHAAFLVVSALREGDVVAESAPLALP